MSPTSSKKVPSSAAPISITVGRLSRLTGARKAPIPTEITPQLATLAEDLPTGRDWLFEIKWDGIRCLSYLRRGELNLVSRNGTSLTEQFPELKEAARSLHAEEAVLDGEIVVFDERGRSDFQALQPRIMSTKGGSASSQAVLILFDLLYFDGYDLRSTPLEDRIRLLSTLVEESPVVRLSSHSRNGRVLLDFAKKHGLEGILAKDARSHYEGRRSTSWRKVKLVREQDCVICGFTTQKRESFASLILGVYQDQKLVHIGNVGTGFDAEQQQILRAMFDQRLAEQTPFPAIPKIPGKITWLRPELVARIKYTQWTKEDRLRAPVFLGLRNDITPQQCVREESALPPPVGAIPSYAQENGAAQVVKAAKRSNLAELPPQQPDSVELRLGENSVRLTNLNKMFFPRDKYTKSDLISYYAEMAEVIRPHLEGRPLVLRRYPDGIDGEAFFQKDAELNIPEWLRQTAEDGSKYIVCQDVAGLYFLVNLGCIDHNPWMSRIDSLESPDYMLIDLDPYECSYERVMEAALLTREVLDECELESYPKTSGGDGFHICIPLQHGYNYAHVRGFAEVLAQAVLMKNPDLFTTPRSVEQRQPGRVYFDYLQISKGKTLASVYSVRAHDGAPVSTPLLWSEVNKRRNPYSLTIRSLRKRLDKYGDLFLPTLKGTQSLIGPLSKLEKMLQRG